MKANELMIGDWVCYDGDTEYTCPVKIEGMDVSCDFCVTSDRDDTGFNGVIPIPLSVEILEKNGWKRAEFWHEYKDGESTIQACLPDMRGIINGVEIQHFNCKYVHQYQHALRLCGLNELADNFKV